MSYEVYKLLHFLGIIMLLLSLGGMLVQAINGNKEYTWRRHAIRTHGVGLALVIVAGFGLLARLGISWPMPGWVIVKIIIWLILGGMVVFIKRAPEQSRLLWSVVLVLAVLAAFLAVYKPF